MAEQTILDQEQVKKIITFLNSSDDKNRTLAVSIVDNCNIEKSFGEILQIMSGQINRQYTMNTELITSKNLQQYIVGELLLGDINLIPADHDLNFIIDLWERHNKLQIIKEDLRVRKRLIKAYVGRLHEGAFEFKDFDGPNFDGLKGIIRKTKPVNTATGKLKYK